MANKVKYGLKNVHYAVITNNSGVVSYGTPKPIPGAVNLSLDAKGESEPFYADDGMYFMATQNDGYEGSVEVALVPDSFKIDVLGYEVDSSGAVFENADANPKEIALLYEFSGDVNATRHVLYNVSCSRPKIESETKTSSIAVKTDSFDITASPALDTRMVKAKAEYSDTSYANWYTAIYLKNAPVNTVASSTASFSKAAPADITIDTTSTDGTNAVKNVMIDGVNVGGAYLTVSGVDVVIDDAVISALENGTHTIVVEYNRGNSVTVALTVGA